MSKLYNYAPSFPIVKQESRLVDSPVYEAEVSDQIQNLI